ncbi:MAG: hypothetical protein D6681_10070 [Calditrichaeota bacterium]|nr:MAG: hypothetical protein D6681_10070 [Calditrichota bacterium]
MQVSITKSAGRVRAQSNSSYRKQLIWLSILIIVYLASRTYNLTGLPIYQDEALHIQRAIKILNGNIFAGAQQGKWLGVVLMAPFIGWSTDLLWAARLSSVIYGIGTLLACYRIGLTLYRVEIGLLAAVFYVFMPYGLFFNRVALIDGATTFLAGWIIYFAIKTVRSSSIYAPFWLTITLSAGILTKLTGIIFIAIPILAIFLLSSSTQNKFSLFKKVTPAIIIGLTISCLAFYYGWGRQEVITKTAFPSPSLLFRNLTSILTWFWYLLTPPLVILLAFTLIHFIFYRRTSRNGFLIALLMLIFPYLLISDELYPRYILFSIIPACLLLAVEVWYLSQYIRKSRFEFTSLVSIAGITLSFMWMTQNDLSLLNRPANTPLPTIMKIVYVQSTLSGYGIRELSTFLIDLAENEPDGVNLFRFECWDQLKFSLPLYLPSSLSLVALPLSDDFKVKKQIHQTLTNAISQRRTFLLYMFPSDCYPDQITEITHQFINAQKIWSIANPDGEQKLEVWEIKSVR